MKLFIILFFLSSLCFSQQNRLSQYIDNHFNKETSQTLLFKEVTDEEIIAKYNKFVTKCKIVTIDEAQLKQIMDEKKQSLDLLIPFPDGIQHHLTLVSNGFNDDAFDIKTSNNEVVQKPKSIHYRGIIDNDGESIAAMSFFENEVMGVIAKQTYGNITIGKITNTKDLYIIYSDKDLINKRPFSCGTNEEQIPLPSTNNIQQYKTKIPTVAVDKCIQIYLETDFALYTDKGSSSGNVTTWVTGMFNVWAAVYQNEGIKIEISEIYIWTTADPFTHTTSSTGLNSFDAIRTTFNGDYAHLLSKLGGDNLTGGLAWLGPACSDPNRTAYSGIDGSYQNLPTYSNDILIVSHEFGHNLGSNHTQWCGWPGGAIDNCYAVEGSCSPGPAPIEGTIMSYCHLTIGTNLALGFGPLPHGVIINEYNTRSCLQQCQCALTIDKSVTDATCNGFTNGAITTTITGGSGTLYYSWTNGATTYTTQNLTNVTSGNYTLTVSQGSLCAKSQTATVLSTIPNPNVATVSNSVCLGGTVTISASGANTYTWSNGVISPSIAVSPSVATTYTCFGSDSNGCIGTKVATVNVNNINFLSTPNSSVCLGGTVTISASGANTYTWSNGVASSSIVISPSVATTYTCFGMDSNGCIDIKATTITVNNIVFLNIPNSSICNGASKSISPSGGTTFTWSTGSTAPFLLVTPSVTTTYSVFGKDANGCKDAVSFVVTVNNTPTLSVTSNSVCNGGFASLSVNGSSATYSWSTNDTGPSITTSPSVTTNYTCTGTSSQGCSAKAIGTVSVSPNPTVTISSGTICIGKTQNMVATGATNYTWNTGANTPSIAVSPTVTTTYTCTGTYASGCSHTAVKTVTVYNLPNVAITSASVCAGNTSIITASGANSYNWNTGATTYTLAVSPNTNTTYSVLGTSVNGCTNVATSNVLVYPTPTLALTSGTICYGMTATVSAAPATSYTWSNGSNASSFFVVPNATTVYTCTGASSQNCPFVSTTTLVVISVSAPSITQSGMTLTSSSVTGNQWYFNGVAISGANGQSYTATQNGNYSVIITGANGCQSDPANKTILDTGLKDLNLKDAINLYPNPAYNQINVIIPNTITDVVKYRIYSSNGQLVKDDILNLELKSIEITDISVGLYLIEFSMKNNRASFKFIKDGN